MNHILDRYRSNVHTALTELKIRAVEDLQNGVQFRRSVPGHTFTPATTPEEIAMIAVEKTARIKALTEALAVLEDTYKRLFEKEDEDGF